MRGEAHTDPLTGLFNRRGLEPFVEQALARASRTGEEIAVLLCDVDHFKRINDEHGHAAGDRALASVARAMESVIRPSDLAARLGGDELVILLAGSNAAGATVVAERLRRALVARGTTNIRGLSSEVVLDGSRAAVERGDPRLRRERLDRCAGGATRSSQR